jgi:uncharacterized protein (TIGR02246 family)
MTRPRTPVPGVDARSAAACHAVLVEFLAAIDHGHASTALDLFTEDASFTARGQQLHGREAISGFLTQREVETDRQTVHIIANETARTDDTREAVTLDAVLVLLVRNEAGQYVIDRVLDTTQQVVPTPAGWRITSRDTTPFHPPTQMPMT